MPSSITLTVKHLPTSTSFFLSCLQPLDYIYKGRIENTIGFGTKDSPPDFWISQETPGIPAGAAHVAFPATSQKNVHEFFVSALKAGGKCQGEPVLRDPVTGYFSAAVIDFDGNSIEAVYRPDLLDEGYGSRPSSVSSVSSVKSKSTMGSKAPTMVSKASTIKPAPTEVRSVAPSQASRTPLKAPTSASRSLTSASKPPTQVSRVSAAAPTHISRTPSERSRPPTSISRTPSNHAPSHPSTTIQAPLQTHATTHTTPTGEVVTTLVTEARGTLNLAKDLVNHVRPALDSANSAPSIHASVPSDSNSHKPSDTIVGTLLGVAAGAALHYAYTKATEPDKRRDDIALPLPAHSRPNMARTNTEPSFANGHSDERMYYYHEYNRAPANQPYAIEAPPSKYSRYDYEPSRAGTQRYITMEDNAEHLSDYAPSARPRRRSSFSGVDARSLASQSRASQNPGSRGAGTPSRMLEAPPTSYRAPTAITQVTSNHDADSRVNGRSRSKSRLSSVVRASSVSGESKASKRSSSRSGRRGSDEDRRSLADKGGSTISRRTSAHTSTQPSRASSQSRAPSDATTVKPIRPAPSVVPAASMASTSKPTSRAPSDTAVRPEDRPLPPSRAGTTVSASDYHSTHSKANKTVIGRMIEKDRQRALTMSVVGKLEGLGDVNVTDREVDPSDSVSQVSSVRSKRSSKR